MPSWCIPCCISIWVLFHHLRYLMVISINNRANPKLTVIGIVPWTSVELYKFIVIESLSGVHNCIFWLCSGNPRDKFWSFFPCQRGFPRGQEGRSSWIQLSGMEGGRDRGQKNVMCRYTTFIHQVTVKWSQWRQGAGGSVLQSQRWTICASILALKQWERRRLPREA